GRLELFFAGPAGAIQHAWQTAPNSAWTGASALGGAAKKLVAGANADGRVEVFYVGTNDQLFHRVQLPTRDWSDEIAFGVAGREPAGCTQQSRAMTRRIHAAWFVAATAFIVLLAAAAVRATPSVIIVPLQNQFGWSRALISGAISINLVLYGLVGPFAAAIMQ